MPLQEIYSASPLATAFVSRDGELIWRNDAAVRLYPSLSLPQGLFQLLPAEQAEALIARLSGAEPFTVPLGLGDMGFLFLPAPDFWIMQAIQQAPQDGDPLRSRGAQRVISAFNASQRRPLSAILSGAAAVARAADVTDDEALRDTARRINEGAYRLLRFTQTMTQHLRLQYGLSDMQSACFDLSHTIGALGAAAAFSALRAEIPLETEVPPEPVLVVADEAQLIFAVLHLLSNSCRYTRPGNRIVLRLATDGGSAVLTVSDAGMGIGPAVLARVGEPYFSLDGDGAPDTGTGLGVSVAAQIVRAAGGTFALTSAPGEGTTAVIRLPLAPSGAEESLHASPVALERELRERFSALQVILSDGCGAPNP